MRLGILDRVEAKRTNVTANLHREAKDLNGQYMTPASIAAFMAHLFEPRDSADIRLLDPGAGSGALTAAFLDQWCEHYGSHGRISVTAYEIDPWIWADGFDAVGDLNRFESFARPLPEFKNNTYVNWTLGGHNFRLEWWHTDGYNDKSQPDGADWSIDKHDTFDLHYNFRFANDNARLFASVYNLTDEDPPFARLDLNYDPYTHNPFGRMIKVGVQWRFEAGAFR